MSSSQPDPDKPRESQWREPGSASRPRSPGEEAGLFEEILQETTHALISSDPLTAEEKRSFEEVAVRLRGRSLPLETVVAELVLVAIKNHLSRLPGSDELGRALSQRVARTLIEDPAAKVRLATLWNRLQGAPP